MRAFRALPVLLVVSAMVIPAVAQQQGPEPAELVITPETLTVEVGETTEISAVVQDADGNVIEGATVLFFSTSRRAVGVTPAGRVEAYRPGEFNIMARVPMDANDTGRRGEARLQATIPVIVPYPPITAVELVGTPGRYYAGTSFRPEVVLTDRSGATRSDVDVEFETSNSAVAEVTTLGRVKLLSAGEATITANAESASISLPVRVETNPTARIELRPSATTGRAGDVIHLNAQAVDTNGNPLPDVPIQYSFQARTVDYNLGQAPSGLITEDGRFVADVAGEYVIVANAGDHSSMETLEIVPRDVTREIELVGARRRTRPPHVGPVGVGGSRRPRLCHHRNLGRRGPRLFLGRHRSRQHEDDRYGARRCAHGERREGLRGRPHRRDQP